MRRPAFTCMKPGMFQRILPVLVLVAHIALWVAAALTLGKLEGPYPDHFDIHGQPDSWTDAGWWLLPLIAAIMTAFLFGMLLLARRLAIRHPAWVNIPRKADWLKLPPEARLRSLKALEGLLLGVTLFLNLIFVSITLDTFGVATGRQPGLSTTKLVIVLVCLAVWLVLSVIRIRQAVGDEVRAQRQRDAAPPSVESPR